MTTIRSYAREDWAGIWNFMEPIIREGETYPYAADTDAAGAQHLWLDITEAVFVVEDDNGDLIGTYYIKPNQPALGAHVANCGYMVAAAARGRGIATKMCNHSQTEAVSRGYRAMQFNLVVESNRASVYLWQKLGFDIVGRLPGAFAHLKKGFVDAFIMYKVLK